MKNPVSYDFLESDSIDISSSLVGLDLGDDIFTRYFAGNIHSVFLHYILNTWNKTSFKGVVQGRGLLRYLYCELPTFQTVFSKCI